MSSARHESSSGAAAASSSDGSGDPRGYGAIDSMEFSDSRVRDALHGRSQDGDDPLSTTSSDLGIGISFWACGVGVLWGWFTADIS